MYNVCHTTIVSWPSKYPCELKCNLQFRPRWATTVYLYIYMYSFGSLLSSEIVFLSILHKLRFSSESEESDSSSESEQENEERVSSTYVDPGVKVPAEIDSSSRSWLYRRSRTPSPKEGDESKEKTRKRLAIAKLNSELYTCSCARDGFLNLAILFQQINLAHHHHHVMRSSPLPPSRVCGTMLSPG